MSKDPLIESATSHWAPRMISNGVMLTDFNEITASLTRWDDWRAAWSQRAGSRQRTRRPSGSARR